MGRGLREQRRGACRARQSPWEGCPVHEREAETRRKPMASFQNFVNCSHNLSVFFKVAQVLGAALEHLSFEFKGFRV